jgi:carboxypeptidase D
MEVGPYRVRKGGKLEAIDGAWNEFANLLFVDNPVGTGFSYVDTNAYVHELQDMADQFVKFLEQWFQLFPHYQHDDVCALGKDDRALKANAHTDLYCGRIVRGSAYSVCSKGDA